MRRIERRTLLAMGGSAAVGAAVGGLTVGAVTTRENQAGTPEPTVTEPVTFARWRSLREPPYYIAHRGAGAVVPEHTLPGFELALAWRSEVIEISVVRSSDDDLFCMHDLALDRTTTGRGPAVRQSSAALSKIRVNVPRLGPRWVGREMPMLPRLADVLTLVGGKAVLAIEAKDDSAYPLVQELIAERGLADSIMVKLTGDNPRIPAAQAAGYPVFAYFSDPDRTTRKVIDEAGAGLDPEKDALVLPARSLSSDLVQRAVDTGVPVWVAPVHRRHEVEHFSRLGVEGFVGSDVGYLTGVEPRRTVDNWASGAISPGELTRDPYSDAAAIRWEEEGVIGLDHGARPSFLSLGQYCPIAAKSYRIVFDVSFDPLPSDLWNAVSIAFGHTDDSYYEHRLAASNGFHAQLRANGNMAIYAHVEGNPNGQLLTPTRSSTVLKPGLWARLTLDVAPGLIRWSRDDGTSVEARDARFQGGYFHIGRSGTDGLLRMRNLSVT